MKSFEKTLLMITLWAYSFFSYGAAGPSLPEPSGTQPVQQIDYKSLFNELTTGANQTIDFTQPAIDRSFFMGGLGAIDSLSQGNFITLDELRGLLYVWQIDPVDASENWSIHPELEFARRSLEHSILENRSTQSISYRTRLLSILETRVPGYEKYFKFGLGFSTRSEGSKARTAAQQWQEKRAKDIREGRALLMFG